MKKVATSVSGFILSALTGGLVGDDKAVSIALGKQAIALGNTATRLGKQVSKDFNKGILSDDLFDSFAEIISEQADKLKIPEFKSTSEALKLNLEIPSTELNLTVAAEAEEAGKEIDKVTESVEKLKKSLKSLGDNDAVRAGTKEFRALLREADKAQVVGGAVAAKAGGLDIRNPGAVAAASIGADPVFGAIALGISQLVTQGEAKAEEEPINVSEITLGGTILGGAF
jgi:hypothetical protein